MPLVEVPKLGLVEFPDGMSEADMAAAIKKSLTPTQPGRSWLENAALSAGLGATDLGRGLKQRAMEFGNAIGDVSDEALATNQADVEWARETARPVTEAPGGTTGYALGQAGVGLPAAFVPGANSLVGATLLGALYGGLQPTAEGESAGLNAAVGGATGAAGQGLSNVLGNAVRSWLGQRAGQNASVMAQNATRNAQVGAAVGAGYRLPPASTNPGSLVNNLLTGIGGKNAVAQRAAQLNQPVTNKLARQALGMADDDPLTEGTITRKINEWVKTGYEPIRKAGKIVADPDHAVAVDALEAPRALVAADFPESLGMQSPEVEKIIADLRRPEWDANSVVEAVRNYRFDASRNFRSDDPAKVRLAQAQRDAARMLEDLVERNLTARGDDGLVEGFRAARVRIAQANDVLDALRPDGYVDARTIGNKALAGEPLTGPLKTIGETEALFRRQSLNTNPLAVADAAPAISPLDIYGSTIAGIGSLTSGNPAWLAAALPAARSGARAVALSAPYQARRAIPRAPSLGLPGLMSSLVDNSLMAHALRVGGPIGLLTSE